jgi:hypothetical protein
MPLKERKLQDHGILVRVFTLWGLCNNQTGVDNSDKGHLNRWCLDRMVDEL